MERYYNCTASFASRSVLKSRAVERGGGKTSSQNFQRRISTWKGSELNQRIQPTNYQRLVVRLRINCSLVPDFVITINWIHHIILLLKSLEIYNSQFLSTEHCICGCALCWLGTTIRDFGRTARCFIYGVSAFIFLIQWSIYSTSDLLVLSHSVHLYVSVWIDKSTRMALFYLKTADIFCLFFC